MPIKNDETYISHVSYLEENLAPCAKKSFEAFSQSFVDGGQIHDHYEKNWNHPDLRQRLVKRTPHQIERDRIVHSKGSKKLTEKYHILYNGNRRIVRNYVTHTMRLAQITHAISRWLNLNGDFAEAIALGSKIGCLPFIHASKKAVSDWVIAKIKEVDTEFSKTDPGVDRSERQLKLEFDFGDNTIPTWFTNLSSPTIRKKVEEYIPWAAGKDVGRGYSSGKQGYWMLSTNPFVLKSKYQTYSPELMFGIWRHSLDSPKGKDTFLHQFSIDGASQGHHEIRWDHITYEGIVVQIADDITWVIENLNDANAAALLNKKRSLYSRLQSNLGSNVPYPLMDGLTNKNSGRIYTYFINEFNKYSDDKLKKLKDGVADRIALREGKDEAIIGLTPEAYDILNKMKDFLYSRVFSELRVSNRKKMLETISKACMDLLYSGEDELLSTIIEEKALIEQWPDGNEEIALSLIKDPICRIQICLNIFCDMSDQEIYDFVGIDSL